MIGRCNPEAESALLGALMIDNRAVDIVAPIVRVQDFSYSMFARIYDRILSLTADGKNANPVTLRPFFDREMIEFENDHTGFPARDPIPVPSFLVELTGNSLSLLGVKDYAEQIRDLARLRALHEVYKEAAQRAVDTSEEIDPTVIIADVDAQVAPLSGVSETMRTVNVKDAWDEAFDEINAVGAGAEPAGMLIAQYTDFNEIAGRMEGGDLLYLGGRPSMGKSGVGFAVAAGAAAAGEPTELIGIEMNKRQTMRRIIAQQIYQQGVTSTYSNLTRGKLKIEDARAIEEARARIDDWDLNISCPDEMNVEDLGPFLRRRKRALAAKGKTLKLVVLDYLGRLGTRLEFRSPNERVTYISRMLKSVAKTLDVALIVLVQLSRDVERRDDKRPILADMRDSGSLEQDADIVVFVYRDEYYLERAEPPQTDEKKYNAWRDEMLAAADRIEVYSAKKREGALCKRTGFFFTRYQALRPSNFYNSDMFRRDHQPGTFFEDNDLPERRG